MTITCGIQPTGVVIMGMEVLYNTCNMCICDLPHMYAKVLGWQAQGLRHTYQINPSCPCYNYYLYTSCICLIFSISKYICAIGCLVSYVTSIVNREVWSTYWSILSSCYHSIRMKLFVIQMCSDNYYSTLTIWINFYTTDITIINDTCMNKIMTSCIHHLE